MISKRSFTRLTLLLSAIAVLIALGVSVYLLVYKSAEPNTNIPTPRPTPTPTPAFLPYINKPANYVGEIEQINSATEIILLREDDSKLVLNLKPNIPIYQVINSPNEVPDITSIPTDQLRVGDTLSVYTEENTIVAIFLFGRN